MLEGLNTEEVEGCYFLLNTVIMLKTYEVTKLI